MCSAKAAVEEERTFTVTARRAQIVQAAIDTIAEVGYAKASLDRIGARIGISKGLIGYHFAGASGDAVIGGTEAGGEKPIRAADRSAADVRGGMDVRRLATVRARRGTRPVHLFDEPAQ